MKGMILYLNFINLKIIILEKYLELIHRLMNGLHIKDVKVGNKEISMGTNYSYPTLLLKKNDKKYIGLFNQGRIILIKRKKNERCYVLNYVEPVGNYFPQDMLNNKKYFTKEQAIEFFGYLLNEFDKNNTKNMV